MRMVILKTGGFLSCCFVALLLLMAPQGATAQDVLDGQLRLNPDGSGTSELRLYLPEDLYIEDVVFSFEDAGYSDVQYEDLSIWDYRISADFTDLNEIFIDSRHRLSDGSVEVLIPAWLDFLPPDLYFYFELAAEDYTMTVYLPGPIRETDGRKQSANTAVFGKQGGTVTYQSSEVSPTASPPPSPSPTMHTPVPSTVPPSPTLVPSTVPPSATPRPPGSSSGGVAWWVWLIVGIGAALLLAVLFLVFFLVRRPPSPPISRGRFCTNCGAREEGSSRFCSGCGKPLTG
jgi:hypothetical protein